MKIAQIFRLKSKHYAFLDGNNPVEELNELIQNLNRDIE
jgi:hypothetical protein